MVPCATVKVVPPTVGGSGQKSVAVPLNVTACGLFVALSAIVSVALLGPLLDPHCAPEAGAAGLNVTCTVQVPPPGTAPVQLFFSVKSAVSVTVTPLTVNAPCSEFVSVTVAGEFGVAATNWLPKLIVEGDTDTVATVTAPASEIV